jgi:hypothetical protein
LRYIEQDLARGLPTRVLGATGDERHKKALLGEEVEPALEDVARELAGWLVAQWADRAVHDRDAFEMARFTLEWALAREERHAAAVETRVAEWALGLRGQQLVFAADWLARRKAWRYVVTVLHPQRDVLLNPRTMNLYAAAMTELGRLEELTEEMGRHNSRWPEPVSILWTVQESISGRRLSSQPVLEGLLMRAARGAQSLNPPWIFDIARAAFMAGLPESGQNLILIATEEPQTRERALGMLLDRMLQEARGGGCIVCAGAAAATRQLPRTVARAVVVVEVDGGGKPA